uniref:Uncharacterized protein n=1 Tax=Eutreptiella gymnastica TaxID=73025 RepID=A0A7S4GJ97_9EUGL
MSDHPSDIRYMSSGSNQSPLRPREGNNGFGVAEQSPQLQRVDGSARFSTGSDLEPQGFYDASATTAFMGLDRVCPEPVADGAQAMDRPSTAETVQSAGDIAVVQEMKEAAAHQWAQFMEFGRSRLSEPTPEDLNHLHIPDFTMGAPVKTARHDLLWALATAQQPHTPPELPSKEVFQCRVRFAPSAAAAPEADSPRGPPPYPLTAHCVFGVSREDGAADTARLHLEKAMRKFLLLSLRDLPRQEPQLVPMLRLLEGNSSSITFEDPQQSVPSSTVLLAITPAYTLSLYDDIQTRRERLIASRLVSVGRKNIEASALFDEDTLLFYLLQLLAGFKALDDAGICGAHVTAHQVLIQRHDSSGDIFWADALRIAPVGSHAVAQVASCNGRAGLASVLHEMMDGYSSKFGLEHGFWGPEAQVLLDQCSVKGTSGAPLQLLMNCICRWLWRDCADAAATGSLDNIGTTPITLKELQEIFDGASWECASGDLSAMTNVPQGLNSSDPAVVNFGATAGGHMACQRVAAADMADAREDAMPAADEPRGPLSATRSGEDWQHMRHGSTPPAGTFLKPADAELQSKVAKLFGRADAVSDTESVISD